MEARLKEDRVRAEKASIPELYEKGYYGRPKGNELELRCVEAAFLLYREKLKIELEGKALNFRAFFEQASLREKNFELKYIVYKDLRERGYYVQPSSTDFRVYPRGGHPGKTAAKSFVYVHSERAPLPVQELLEAVDAAENVHKQLILAIVDEESDITFYEAKTLEPKGEMEQYYPKIRAEGTFLEDRVIVWEKNSSKKLYEYGFYGKALDSERLQLSLVESLYLLEKGVLGLKDRKGKSLKPETFLKKASLIEEAFFRKFKVYRALRDSGHVAKTGFKFGTHFRVYRKVKSPEKIPHSEYLVSAIPGAFEFRLPVMSGAVRLANSVRKRMLFAIEESEELRFLDIGRVKL
ncbi:MAG: tRNA-intron lyase [Methanosarcinaceae archaeon]|nr:tRNA-intron lyase [Methanosarcinaceae archaeon]